MSITDIDMFHGGTNKEEMAIALIQAYQPVKPYYVANSGGKDSAVIEHLTQRATSNYQSYYCVSPIDPKEIHQHLRQHYPDTIWEYHAKNFWATVRRKQLPRRQGRWCCEIIKEAGGAGRVIILGNRRAESSRRKNQLCFERQRGPKLDESKRKLFLRPIIDWTHDEVWEYIRKYDLPYCSIYDEGTRLGLSWGARKGYGEGRLNRLGCVLCPFAKDPEYEIVRFPKIARLWRKSCDQIMEDILARGNKAKNGKPYKHQFQSGQELWDWWISRK